MMVPRIRNNVALMAKAVNGPILQQYIEKVVTTRAIGGTRQQECAFPDNGAEIAAKIVLEEIRRLCGG
jgi:hypothetical protein